MSTIHEYYPQGKPELKDKTNLEEESSLKKDSFWVQGKILKRWKKREIVLNPVGKCLIIKKKSKQSMIFLRNYSIYILGPLKKKIAFTLFPIKTNSMKKEKTYIIGCENQVILNDWVSSIAQIINLAQGKMIPSALHPEEDIVHAQGGRTESPPENTENIKKPALFIDSDQILITDQSFSLHNGNLTPEGNPNSPYQWFNFNIFNNDDNFESRQRDSISAFFQPPQIREIVNEIDHHLENPYFTEEFMEESEIWSRVFSKDKVGLLINRDKPRFRLWMLLRNFSTFEIFNELRNPEKYVRWNHTIETIKKEDIEEGHICKVTEIYRPSEIIPKPCEVSTTRYQNKSRNFYVIVSKSLNEQPFKKAEKAEMDISMKKSVAPEAIQMNVIASFIIIMKYFKEGEEYCLILKEKEIEFPSKELSEETVRSWGIQNMKDFAESLLEQSSKNHGEDKSASKFKNSFAFFEDSAKKEEVPNRLSSTPPVNKEITVYTEGNAEFFPSKEFLLDVLSKMKKKYHEKQVINVFHHTERILPDPVHGVQLESSEDYGHFCFKKDYVRAAKKGGLNYFNTALMAEQRKVLAYLVKKLSTNLFTGKGLQGVTMPLEIFEARSFLERLGKSFGYAPVFLERAGEIKDPVEQLKISMAFFMATLPMNIAQDKPFNPILGETFQGRLNGYPIYLEQVCHHPPITYYNVFGSNYLFSGHHEFLASLTPNTLHAELKGNPSIEFKKTKSKVLLFWPSFMIYGSAIGQRSLNYISRAFAIDVKNSLVCEIIFNIREGGLFKNMFRKSANDGTIDEFGGGIYKVKPEIIQKIIASKKPHKLSLNLNNDVEQFICEASGIWCEHLDFDGKRYWDINVERPYLLEYEKFPLPSDARFREDVLYKRMDDNKKGEEEKERLEILQRHDKKLRDANAKRLQNELKKSMHK